MEILFFAAVVGYFASTMLQAVGASDGSVEAITAAVDQYVNQANGK